MILGAFGPATQLQLKPGIDRRQGIRHQTRRCQGHAPVDAVRGDRAGGVGPLPSPAGQPELGPCMGVALSHDVVAVDRLRIGALVAGAAGFVGTATPAAALPASSWNIGLGLCTAKSALTNNAYPASMSAAALNNFPHGSVHKSDADMPGWPGYTGADTHVYSSYKAGSQWSCRWVDFTSHADGATRSYHCLVVGATSYKGTASRPYTPDPHPSAAVVDISNAALETYWCD